MSFKHFSAVKISIFISLMLLLSSSMAFGEVTYLYDDLGQLKKVVDEDGNVATYNYDAVGNLLSITRRAIEKIEKIGVSP